MVAGIKLHGTWEKVRSGDDRGREKEEGAVKTRNKRRDVSDVAWLKSLLNMK